MGRANAVYFRRRGKDVMLGPVEPARLYRLPEAAKILGLTVVTVRNLVKSGRLAFFEIKRGGHKRIKGSVLIAFGTPSVPQRPAVLDLNARIKARREEFRKRFQKGV